MPDFRRITLFYLGYCLSRHKMTICSENLGGPWSPWLRLCLTSGRDSRKHIVMFLVSRTVTNGPRCASPTSPPLGSFRATAPFRSTPEKFGGSSPNPTSRYPPPTSRWPELRTVKPTMIFKERGGFCNDVDVLYASRTSVTGAIIVYFVYRKPVLGCDVRENANRDHFLTSSCFYFTVYLYKGVFTYLAQNKSSHVKITLDLCTFCPRPIAVKFSASEESGRESALFRGHQCQVEVQSQAYRSW